MCLSPLKLLPQILSEQTNSAEDHIIISHAVRRQAAPFAGILLFHTCWLVEAFERVVLQLEISDHYRSSHTQLELLERKMEIGDILVTHETVLLDKKLFKYNAVVESYLVVYHQSVWGLQSVQYLPGCHTALVTSSLPHRAMRTCKKRQ